MNTAPDSTCDAPRPSAPVVDELAFLSIRDLQTRLLRGDFTVAEFVRSQLSRIRAKNPLLRAFVTVDESAAGIEVCATGGDVAAPGSPATLNGVTFSVKDNFATRGLETGAGSRLFDGFRPDADAKVVADVRGLGAVLLGKTRMYELACGMPEVEDHDNTVRNPWDLTRSVGGSSSGSAAAVAAGMSVVSIASDTAGSARVPAALCGVVGYKPVRGTLSSTGLIPFSSEHDAVALVARTVDDIRAVLNALVRRSGQHMPRVRTDGVRLGVPDALLTARAHPEVAAAFEAAVSRLHADHGVIPTPVSFPDLDELNWHFGRLVRAEAATSYAEPACRRPGVIGRTTRERILPYATMSASDYLTSQRAIAAASTAFAGSVEGVEVFALPTTPVTAPLLAERERLIDGKRVVLQDHLSLFTIMASAFDLPAVSICCGHDENHLPIGLQLISLPTATRHLSALASAAELPNGSDRPPETGS